MAHVASINLHTHGLRCIEKTHIAVRASIRLALGIWLLPAASPDGRVNEVCGDVNCF